MRVARRREDASRKWDVSRLKKAYIYMRQSRAAAKSVLALRVSLLERAFDAMTDGVCVYDANGAITYANAAVHALLSSDLQPVPGYAELSLEERMGRFALRDEDGHLLPHTQWPVHRVLRGEVLSGAGAVEFSINTLSGSVLEISATGAPIRDEEGEIVGGVVVLRDVTGRRLRERHTRDALTALLAMAQALVDPLPLSNLDDALPYDSLSRSSRTSERIIAQRLATLTCTVLGCTRVGIIAIEPETDALRAIAVVGLSPEQERQWWAEQRELERKGARLGDGASPDVLARFRAGEVFIVDMTQPPFSERPNPYGITTNLIAPMHARDVLVGMLSLDYGGAPHVFTKEEMALAGAVAQLSAVVIERERLLRARAVAEAETLALQTANQRMDEFLGIASHELRTPLTTVKANLQLAERRVTRMRDELAAGKSGNEEEHLKVLEEMLTRALTSAERQQRLVEDLLDVSRIQEGKLEMHVMPCDLVALSRENVEEHRISWPQRSISFETTDECGMAEADPDRIGQVLTNYLTNALKYSEESKPVVVAITEVGAMLRVSVRDEGPGIPDAERERVWERFHRVSGVERRSGSGVGLGLGLYISKTIVERHGGEVGVESVPGEGSTFWFTVPRL